MHERELVRRKRDDWEKLSDLVETARRKGLANLPQEKLASIGPLYRQAVSDLSLAKTHFPTGQTTGYLNQLVSQAHTLIYGGGQMSWRGLLRFFTHTFPATVREERRVVLFMALLFTIALSVGAWGYLTEHPLLAVDLPPGLLDQIEETEDAWQTPWEQHELPMFASYIMTNNIQVSLLAFALGVTFGVGALWVIWINGYIIGPLTAAFHQHGLGVLFWSLILPHGVLELPAIFFSATSGWLIGRALLLPGERRRFEAAREAAGRALVLLGGTVFILVIAALIEGFFTPSSVAPGVKLIVSAGTFLLFLIYLSKAGRGVERGEST